MTKFYGLPENEENKPWIKQKNQRKNYNLSRKQWKEKDRRKGKLCTLREEKEQQNNPRKIQKVIKNKNWN